MRVAGLVLLALVVLAAVWRLPPAFTTVADDLEATSGLTRDEREVSPARSVDIDPRPIEAAARLIPPGASFAILVGEGYPFTHEISGLTLPTWAAYRLLPRRRVADAAAADWVISYEADLAAHNVYPRETRDLGLRVTLAKVP